ncbi:hypothetical protein K7G98_00875 [Saccharothrix sp. MB29]|nr:hypothetical protein [Saccharothrix sp. MB29]
MLARVEALVERVDRMVPVVEVDVPAQARERAGRASARGRRGAGVPAVAGG